MGTYIAWANIEAVFGADNVAAWSDLSGGQTADTGRITSAISWAEAWVEARFRRSEYAVPFVIVSGTYDPLLIDWCANLAGYWLYRSRGVRRSRRGGEDAGLDFVKDEYDRVQSEIAQAIAGPLKLNLGLVASESPTAPQIVT